MERLDLLLSPSIKLPVSDSVGALLTLSDGRYLVQKRDLKAGIFFPGFLSLFGGGIENGEKPSEALARELREELSIDVDAAKPFGTLSFDWAGVRATRWFFEATVTSEQIGQIQLGEGAGMHLLNARELFSRPETSPVDAQAIWFHHCRSAVVTAQPELRQ